MNSVEEVAKQLVELCREEKFEEVVDTLYSDGVVSIEPNGAPVKEMRGISRIREKALQFNAMIEKRDGVSVSEPLIAGNFFTVLMKMNVEFRGGSRTVLEELCMYQVYEGKIIYEEFFFTPMGEDPSIPHG
jgi:hypothetical protein